MSDPPGRLPEASPPAGEPPLPEPYWTALWTDPAAETPVPRCAEERLEPV